MNERTFRLILGSTLLLLIYLDSMPLYYAYIGILLFEGITNFRIPILINKFRYGKNVAMSVEDDATQPPRINFEAERAMRLVFALVLIPAILFLPKDLWFINWIIASFLTLAGLVNFCPTVVALRLIGFR